MQTVRRLYLYVMSGITFGMLAVGLDQLLVVILGELGVGRGPFSFGDQGYGEQLSLAIALVAVGLPVWAVHWRLAQRGLQAAGPRADEERASTVRALYLTLVLAVLLGFGAPSALELLRIAVNSLAGGSSGDFFSGDPAGALATLIVTGLGWGYHVAVRRSDMRAGRHTGASAWLPRVYLYGASLTGLFLAIQSIGSLVAFLADIALTGGSTFDDPQFRAFQVADLSSAALIWGVVWIGHWWYATGLTRDSGWRGASERPARLRQAFYVAVILAGAASVLRFGSDALRAVLIPVVGGNEALGSPDSSDLLRAVITALIAAIPWGIAWWAHVRWMRGEAARSEDPASVATAVRLDLHAVALVGLAFGAGGVAWLLGLLFDVLLGGDRTGGRDGFWRVELATFVPYAVLGLLAWTWKWWQARARQAADPLGEAGSMVRRSFLMFVLASSIVAGLGSLAVVLYRLLGRLLGANLFGNAASELATPLGILVVAVAVALYHGLALRRDLSLRATAPVPAESIAERRSLVLSGPPGSDLDGTLDALRSGLPEGYRLDEG
jgi:hypothetical protein